MLSLLRKQFCYCLEGAVAVKAAVFVRTLEIMQGNVIP